MVASCHQDNFVALESLLKVTNLDNVFNVILLLLDCYLVKNKM